MTPIAFHKLIPNWSDCVFVYNTRNDISIQCVVLHDNILLYSALFQGCGHCLAFEHEFLLFWGERRILSIQFSLISEMTEEGTETLSKMELLVMKGGTHEPVARVNKIQ